MQVSWRSGNGRTAIQQATGDKGKCWHSIIACHVTNQLVVVLLLSATIHVQFLDTLLRLYVLLQRSGPVQLAMDIVYYVVSGTPWRGKRIRMTIH